MELLCDFDYAKECLLNISDVGSGGLIKWL